MSDIDQELASVGGVPDRISEVLPGQIYLGNKWEAQSSMLRQKHAITHVLSVCSEVADMNDQMLAAPCPEGISQAVWNGLSKPRHLIVHVRDDEDESLLPYFAQTNEFITSALASGGIVYVHCALGVSRSPTFIAAYLMRVKGMTATEAVDFIRKARGQILPNGAFLIQLDLYERSSFTNSDMTGYPSWKTKMSKDVSPYAAGHQGIWKFSDRVYGAGTFANPDDFAKSLLKLGVTHVVSSRSQGVPSDLKFFCLDDFTNDIKRASEFVHTGVESGGTVFVYFRNASVFWYIICGYFLFDKTWSSQDVLSHMDSAEFTDMGPVPVLPPQTTAQTGKSKPAAPSLSQRIRNFFQ